MAVQAPPCAASRAGLCTHPTLSIGGRRAPPPRRPASPAPGALADPWQGLRCFDSQGARGAPVRAAAATPADAARDAARGAPHGSVDVRLQPPSRRAVRHGARAGAVRHLLHHPAEASVVDTDTHPVQRRAKLRGHTRVRSAEKPVRLSRRSIVKTGLFSPNAHAIN